MLAKGNLPLKPLAVILDVFTIVASLYASYWARLVVLRLVPFGGQTEFRQYSYVIFATLIIWIWLFTLMGAYNRPMFVTFRKEFKTVFMTVVLGVFILFASIFFLKVDVAFLPRSFVFIFFVISLLFLTVEKAGLFYLVSVERKKGHNLQSSVIVGHGDDAVDLAKTIMRHPEYGLKPIGLFCNLTPTGVSDLNGVKVLGKVEDVKTYLLQNHVDEVVLTSARELDTEDLLSVCEEEGVRTRLIPNLLNKTESKWGIERIGDLVSLRLYGAHEKEWQIFFKRVVDICLSGILLVLLAPLFALIAVVIKRTSRGPVFYEWNVVGFNKRPFKSWKFRTMVTDADKLKDGLMEKNEMEGPVFKIKDDPRITPVGKFMRKFSLDELPQLYSVLKGDMSLVGPRPPLNSEVSMFERWHGRKLRIKPGITCLWQVNGRNGIKDFDDWVKLDLEYLDNWSLWLDMKILLKTIPAVLRATGH